MTALKKKEKVIKGWWFPHLQYVPRTMKSIPIIRYEVGGHTVELAGTPVRAGQVHHLSDTTKPIRCCDYGLHASRDIGDAAFYAFCPNVVCRVESWGDIDESLDGDKYASRYRRIVRMYWLPDRVMDEYYRAYPGRNTDTESVILMREIRRQDRARKAKAAKKAAAK